MNKQVDFIDIKKRYQHPELDTQQVAQMSNMPVYEVREQQRKERKEINP